jgi:NADH-quinone oxidoreductase subunit B
MGVAVGTPAPRILEGAQAHTKDGSLDIALAKLEDLVNWGRANSVWPLTFGLACCAIEQISAGMSRFDIARFGSEVFRASPRQADLLIVSGRVSNKMGPVIKRVYDQMSYPKWVIAMGDCASCGGPFNNYAIIQGVDKILPVDVYVPGCPPRPEALFYALLRLQQKIKAEEKLGVRE